MLDLKSFQSFTPGRWGKILFSEKAGIPVYRVWRGNMQGGPFAVVAGDIRREPDAALIAAAPDILARALELEAENKRLRARLARDRIELQATADILEANDPLTLENTAIWDGAECDAGCLLDEVKCSVSEIDLLLGESK